MLSPEMVRHLSGMSNARYKHRLRDIRKEESFTSELGNETASELL
jgi:hypothetical protein